MVNWKNLKANPPIESCNVCLKFGTTFDTFKFRRHSEQGWDISRGYKFIEPQNIPDDTLYIILDDII